MCYEAIFLFRRFRPAQPLNLSCFRFLCGLVVKIEFGLTPQRSLEDQVPSFLYPYLRENLHQSNPPIASTATPKTRPKFDPPVEAEDASMTVGVAVCDGDVMDGLGDNTTVVGLGVNVSVAGGVTRSTNFCPGKMTEALFIPFHAIRSVRGTA